MSEYENKYDRRLLARCKKLEAQVADLSDEAYEYAEQVEQLKDAVRLALAYRDSMAPMDVRVLQAALKVDDE
jgi:hypothetical protein